MPTVTPNFHINGRCKDAVALYQKAFDARVEALLLGSDADPRDYVPDEDQSDRVYHAVLYIGRQRVMLCDDTADFPSKGSTLSLVLTFETADEVRRAYDALREGCAVITPMKRTTYSSCFVSLVDRFGVRWELMTEQPDR